MAVGPIVRCKRCGKQYDSGGSTAFLHRHNICKKKKKRRPR
jgi:hypothetical protein